MSNILVVDDNEINAMVLETMLASYGAAVSTVLSGKAAVEESASADYDMIFVDYIMPEMDGVETTKKIRMIKGKKPVIVIITAEVTETLRTQFLTAGANEALEKPLSREELEKCLKKYMPEDGVFLEENTGKKNQAKDPSNERAKKIFSGVRGLDFDIAIHYSLDDAGNFLRLVKTSISNIRDYAVRLREMEKPGRVDTRNARICVHSLRSVLLNIGMKSLSNEAAALEDAANRGDTNTILKALPSFGDSLIVTADELENCVKRYYEDDRGNVSGEENGKSGRNEIGKEEYMDMLRQVMVPLERFEIIFIREALEELRKVSSGENLGLVKEALEASENFDYDKIRSAVNSISDNIRNAVNSMSDITRAADEQPR